MEEVLLMPIDVPSNPKVYTTVYDNFKGVDFTNDSTNIWRRRSPTGLNMLPDASGRPFKRHGWEILLKNEDICTAIGVDSCVIMKCAYFELAGVDHIIVFTDNGLLIYNGDINTAVNGISGVTAISTDRDCYTSYDRCFFFEGGGKSAFYIYGNYRVWIYDATFALRDATSECYVPTVIYTAEADCTGQTNEAYNLLTSLASVEYNNNNLFTYWGTDGLIFEVKDEWKTGKTQGNPSYYEWEYDASNSTWVTKAGETAFDSNNIVASNPSDGNKIVIVYAKGLMLPNNVDETSQGESVKVYTSNITQFDTEITPASPLTQGHYKLHTDTVVRGNRQAWIEFHYLDEYKNADSFEQRDAYKVIFPSTHISITYINEAQFEGTATLVGGGA